VVIAVAMPRGLSGTWALLADRRRRAAGGTLASPPAPAAEPEARPVDDHAHRATEHDVASG
jgi:hypothetical protein